MANGSCLFSRQGGSNGSIVSSPIGAAGASLPYERDTMMATVDAAEVLLLYRALREFRSGRKPACAPHGRPASSTCPLFQRCDRWSGPDDFSLSLDETLDDTERRRASWPCSRLLDLLGPEMTRLGR